MVGGYLSMEQLILSAGLPAKQYYHFTPRNYCGHAACRELNIVEIEGPLKLATMYSMSSCT